MNKLSLPCPIMSSCVNDSPSGMSIFFLILWTIACQAPLSMEFFRQEYWSGYHFLPGDLPDPKIKHGSPTLQENFLPSRPAGQPMSSLDGSKHKAGT